MINYGFSLFGFSHTQGATLGVILTVVGALLVLIQIVRLK
jgi:hypothetical protein